MKFGYKSRERMRNFQLLAGVLVIACFSQCYAASPSIVPTSDVSEAYFNGTAYLRLLSPMPIWGHSAISFRSCKGGEILSQQYNRHTLWLSVLSDYVQVSLTGSSVRVDARLEYKLLDNKWHTIQFLYEFGKLNLIVDRSHTVIANSTYNTAFLTNQDVKNEAAVLILGNNYSGCLLHGPGLVFNASSMNAESVVFGACPLALGPCSDHDVLIKMQPDHCLHEPCMRQGICTSNSEGYECHCTQRYSGKNCEVDLGSPCLSAPCLNGGSCSEDDKGNYVCRCPQTHSGLKCENEISNHPLCMDQPCKNNGTCKVLSNGKTVECDCLKGFSGQYCQVNNDDCASSPCYNNGRCVDMVNGFACDCSGTGYSGTLCQININECSEKPCQNGGICYDTYGSYICECLNGFGGDNCEKQTNECQYQPCQNGASCIDKQGSFKCVCTPGFSGIFCENAPLCPHCPIDSECINGKCVCKPGSSGPIGHCVPTPEPKPIKSSPQSRSAQLNACSHSICLNGGTCNGNASNYTCNCANGFSGPHCENTVNDCQCLNGGVCSGNGTNCSCPNGFDGSKCEKSEQCSPANCPNPMICSKNKCICTENTNCDACKSNPCLNGAVCKPSGLSYECICPNGWNGTNCQQETNECSAFNPCKRGICTSKKGEPYKCYCEPGFTGLHCDIDVDECLSKPCKNGATCVNQINDYQCHCSPGYTGKDCSMDIDECASNPCVEGSTCMDLVNNYTCVCIPGLTGRRCEIDINDCESAPCQHGGQCVDELNGFHCNCSSTGYTGEFCQINIDECASNPCTNGAECIDKVNDYTCQCYPGYEGKNCEIDKNECDPNPCQYNGTCLERSNQTLYAISDRVNLPIIFSQNFSFEIASGYECVCVNGIIGKNCETNINECESNPCSKHGTCVDGVGSYTCDCDPGFNGTYCEVNIDECEIYTPCLHGTCIDRTDDYTCDCDMKYGGKNCSVELIGCLNSPCKNNGTCKPFLINETDHHFNCTCQHGYQGETCEKTTTISMVVQSLIEAKTKREEGYYISFQFRTTLPNGVLAFGTSSGENEQIIYPSYILELINGRLNLHSSLLNKWEGVFIGSNLNDSNWHKFFVAINASHLVLSANDEQAIYPIGSYESANISQTSFPTTFLGGTIPNLNTYLKHLTHQPTSFVGCMRDIVINGKWIFPDETTDSNTNLTNIASGCPRTEQCKPNPCHSNGQCQDLWHTFSCSCQRPHLGQTCKYNITAATFGHENKTHSAVIVETDEKARRAVRSGLDISMFIRTRQPTGQVFYLGSDPRKNISPGKPINDIGDSYVVAKLQGGELLVKMQFNGTPEAYTVGGNKLDNGYNHLIQVIRNQTLVQVKLNGTEYFRKTLSSNGQLDAQVLYLGGPPPAADGSDLNLTEEEKDRLYFKGIIQDVQVSNGSQSMSVELYPLNKTEGLVLPEPFGKVTIDTESVLRGEVSDDLCRKKPCEHNAECKNTWNDFKCTCPKGYKGKYCQDIEFCELNKCPGNGVCQNLDDGFECITNVTFKGTEKTPLSFSYINKNPEEEVKLPVVIEISYRSKTGGTLFYVQDEDNYFEIAVHKDQVTVQWKLNVGRIDYPTTKRFKKDATNYEWNTIYLTVRNGKLECGFKGWEEQPDIAPAFTEHIEENVLQDLISGKHQIYLGGMPLGDNVLSKSNSGAIFKGCIGEVRVGHKLLPFFLYNEMYQDSIQPRPQFKLNGPKVEEGCVLCFQEDCQNGGKCTNSSEQYACTCMPGFEGDDCSTDIDECLTAQCTNNSTCIDEIAGFTCNCLPGFDGKLCEHEIDECESNPCQNGGICTDLRAAYKCDCAEEYAGPQCDVLKLVNCDSDPNPCKKGSCVDGYNATTGNNFTCNCMTGYQGPMCDVPFCFIEECKNGGLCLNSKPLQPPICQCSIGYEGEYCEIDINECEPNPCQNGGQCIDEVGAYKCNCTGTGFEGPQCENDIDECNIGRTKCGGKGACINLPGSFKCECALGLCGYDCHLDDPCIMKESGVCDNGGSCVEKCTDVVDYTCNCTIGFMGKTCNQMAREAEEGGTSLAIIIVPIVVILLLILGAALGTFLVIARNKRATRGTYSPSAQEYCNPRLEMDNVLKPPPEERLI